MASASGDQPVRDSDGDVPIDGYVVLVTDDQKFVYYPRHRCPKCGGEQFKAQRSDTEDGITTLPTICLAPDCGHKFKRILE